MAGYGLLGSKFDYFKYPDGTHCLYKTFCATKFTTIGSMMVGTWEVLGTPKTVNNWQEVALFYPKWVVPGFSTGFVWGATVCFLAFERKKDDEYNYLAGGAAAGMMLGACRRSYSWGFYSTLFGGGLSWAWKYWNNMTNGLEMVPRKVFPTTGQWDAQWFHHYEKRPMIADPGPYDGSEDLQ